jgi:hypothetical protein
MSPGGERTDEGNAGIFPKERRRFAFPPAPHAGPVDVRKITMVMQKSSSFMVHGCDKSRVLSSGPMRGYGNIFMISEKPAPFSMPTRNPELETRNLFSDEP